MNQAVGRVTCLRMSRPRQASWPKPWPADARGCAARASLLAHCGHSFRALQAVLPASALSKAGGPPPPALLDKKAGEAFLRSGPANFFVRNGVQGSKQRTSMLAGIGTVNVDVAIKAAYPAGSDCTWPLPDLWVLAVRTSSKAQARLPASAEHGSAALREQLGLVAGEGEEAVEVTFAEICSAACAGGDAENKRLKPMRKTLLRVAQTACRAAECAVAAGLPHDIDGDGAMPTVGAGSGSSLPVAVWPAAGAPGPCSADVAEAHDGAASVSARTADASGNAQPLPPSGVDTAFCSVSADRDGAGKDSCGANVAQRAPSARRAEAACSSTAVAAISAPWCDADFERAGTCLGQGQTSHVELACEVATRQYFALKVRSRSVPADTLPAVG